MLAGSVSFAHAQTQDTTVVDGDVDPADSARFHAGVLHFTPSIVVNNVGVDSNVFNTSEDPKSDTTAAVGPGINLWVRAGHLRIAEKSTGQYLYFKEFDDQRAWNTSNDVRLELALNRLRPFMTAAYTNSRQRAGYEIDARSRRRDRSLGGGTTWLLSAKTSLVASGTAQRFAYDREETFLGASLADALDRDTTTERLDLRVALTPLTTFVLTGEGIQDRFNTATERNLDSIRVVPTLEFKPAALIAGRIAIGVRRMNSRNAMLPDSTKLIAQTQASYTLRATLFEVVWSRDVIFSYDENFPYYRLNDFGVSLTQRIQRWDVVARGSWQSLKYQPLTTIPAIDGRVDHGSQYGLGTGYRFSNTMRLGVDANYFLRSSPEQATRAYNGLRIGASVSYGTTQ